MSRRCVYCSINDGPADITIGTVSAPNGHATRIYRWDERHLNALKSRMRAGSREITMKNKKKEPPKFDPNSIPNAPNFYKSYFAEYFQYRLVAMRSLLENFEHFRPLLYPNFEPIDADRAKQSLRFEIHFGLYHAIETLFTLFFGLETLDDRNLWYHISKPLSKPDVAFLSKIETVANKTCPLLSPDNHRQLPISFIQYAFYFNRIPPELDANTIKEIREVLILLASIFVERKGYNAFKHGMRLFPFWTAFGFANADNVIQFQADLTHPFTYLILEEDGGITQQTESIDIEKDHKQLEMCFTLISNLIGYRRIHFFPDDAANVQTYNLKSLDAHSLRKTSITTPNASITITPIYAKQKGV